MRSINIKGSYVGELRVKELIELINNKEVKLLKVTKKLSLTKALQN